MYHTNIQYDCKGHASLDLVLQDDCMLDGQWSPVQFIPMTKPSQSWPDVTSLSSQRLHIMLKLATITGKNSRFAVTLTRCASLYSVTCKVLGQCAMFALPT